MSARRAVLITRPEPEASATAQEVSARGFEPVLASALVTRRLRKVEPADLAGAQGAAFTSAAAVKALAEDLGGPPPEATIAYCVGAKTAAAARAAGFTFVIEASGDAAGLLRLLLKLDPAKGPLAVLRARDVATPLGPPLAAAGFETRDIALYGADRVGALPGPALAALDNGRVAAALMLSARTVEAFLALAEAAGRTAALGEVAALCNSPRTAGPARKAQVFRAVLEAGEPTLAATLDLLG